MLVGDTVRVPLVAFAPVHPPEAVHEVALVEDQVTVETLPEVMLVGLAEIDTVGAGVVRRISAFANTRGSRRRDTHYSIRATRARRRGHPRARY